MKTLKVILLFILDMITGQGKPTGSSNNTFFRSQSPDFDYTEVKSSYSNGILYKTPVDGWVDVNGRKVDEDEKE